jgi:cytochrome c2
LLKRKVQRGCGGAAPRDKEIPKFESESRRQSRMRRQRVWNDATFKKYIQNPQGVIPGTKMIFPGVKNEQQVNDLWAYVSQFSSD